MRRRRRRRREINKNEKEVEVEEEEGIKTLRRQKCGDGCIYSLFTKLC